ATSARAMTEMGSSGNSGNRRVESPDFEYANHANLRLKSGCYDLSPSLQSMKRWNSWNYPPQAFAPDSRDSRPHSSPSQHGERSPQAIRPLASHQLASRTSSCRASRNFPKNPEMARLRHR